MIDPLKAEIGIKAKVFEEFELCKLVAQLLEDWQVFHQEILETVAAYLNAFLQQCSLIMKI